MELFNRMKLELARTSLLRREAKPVPLDLIGSCYFQDLVDSLTHLSRKDLGIAAPQVGVDLRIAIIQKVDRYPWVLINPEITDYLDSYDRMEEGCSSLPGISRRKIRSKGIIFTAHDLKRQRYEGRATGLAARIIQHEVDHLNGKLIVDH